MLVVFIMRQLSNKLPYVIALCVLICFVVKIKIFNFGEPCYVGSKGAPVSGDPLVRRVLS